MTTILHSPRTRSASQNDIDAYSGHVIRPIAFVEILLDTPVYLNTSVYEIVHGGKTYEGVGKLLSMSAVEEGIESQAYGIKIGLSGLDSGLITTAMETDFRGTVCVAKVGLFTPDIELVSGTDLITVFKGRIDTMDIEQGRTAFIAANVENVFADWEKANNSRFTHQEQKSRYPGDPTAAYPDNRPDNGLEFVSETVDKEILWGPTAE